MGWDTGEGEKLKVSNRCVYIYVRAYTNINVGAPTGYPSQPNGVENS